MTAAAATLGRLSGIVDGLWFIMGYPEQDRRQPFTFENLVSDLEEVYSDLDCAWTTGALLWVKREDIDALFEQTGLARERHARSFPEVGVPVMDFCRTWLGLASRAPDRAEQAG